MDHTELAKLQNDFRSFGMRDRQAVLNALVEAFRPSDYRHLAHRFMPAAERFVGDLVQVLPAKISDKIFAYCEPQVIFKLKNVSAMWNSYLSQPEFQQRMNHKMYGDSGRYRLDSDCVYTEKASLEERVRSRCALLNGRSHTFEFVRHTNWDEEIQYGSGVLIGLKRPGTTVHVKQLYRNEPGWRSVVGDDLEKFSSVKITPRHILATTTQGVVYCWSAMTLDKMAKFRLPSAPYMVDASSNTVLMICEDAWFLYSLETETLTRMDPLYAQTMTDPNLGERILSRSCRVEQSGFFYRAYGRIIEVYKINEKGTSIDFIERFDMYELSLQQLGHGSSAEEINAVVVCNHDCFRWLRLKSEDTPSLVFELKNGMVMYHHTIDNKDMWDLSKAVYFPQLHRAFNFECCRTTNQPLGFYQIYDKSYRVVSRGLEKVLDEGDRTAMYAQRSRNRTDFKGKTAIWTGDANYLVRIHPEYWATQVWRLRWTAEDHPRTE